MVLTESQIKRILSGNAIRGFVSNLIVPLSFISELHNIIRDLRKSKELFHSRD
jgi:hypothetical protein